MGRWRLVLRSWLLILRRIVLEWGGVFSFDDDDGLMKSWYIIDTWVYTILIVRCQGFLLFFFDAVRNIRHDIAKNKT
jgi:hypothetical protein